MILKYMAHARWLIVAALLCGASWAEAKEEALALLRAAEAKYTSARYTCTTASVSQFLGLHTSVASELLESGVFTFTEPRRFWYHWELPARGTLVPVPHVRESAFDGRYCSQWSNVPGCGLSLGNAVVDGTREEFRFYSRPPHLPFLPLYRGVGISRFLAAGTEGNNAPKWKVVELTERVLKLSYRVKSYGGRVKCVLIFDLTRDCSLVEVEEQVGGSRKTIRIDPEEINGLWFPKRMEISSVDLKNELSSVDTAEYSWSEINTVDETRSFRVQFPPGTVVDDRSGVRGSVRRLGKFAGVGG